MRYYGGKWLLAPWIIDRFPPHRTYVEVFGGAASILLRKPRSYAEVYNDAAEEIVTLFRVLRCPKQSGQLIDALELTPFARAEFKAAYLASDCPVETARRLIIRSFFGFGSTAFNRYETTGFRGKSNRSGTTPAQDWANLPSGYWRIVERMRGVVVENDLWESVVDRYDTADTLFYLDPPYVPDTRSPKHAYYVEMGEADHERFLKRMLAADGMVVLSGYRCDLYDSMLSDWQRFDKETFADGARSRTESLWRNPHCVARDDQVSMNFDARAAWCGETATGKQT